MIDNEKQFYDALGIVPDVPAGMFGVIERRTRRPVAYFRMALAASITLFVSVTAALVLKFGPPSSAVYADDFDPWDELIYTFDHVNGNFDHEFQLSSFIEEVFE